MSSDAGGCLPVFDAEKSVASYDVGQPGALAHTLKQLLCTGHALERVLPAFTSNVARILRLPRKGHLSVGADADLAVLTSSGDITDVMAMGRWHVRNGRPAVLGSFEEANA